MNRGESRHSRAREEMVEGQLAARGIRDARILDAMRRVPRHLFVPDFLEEEAYSDKALPIGHGQTISQPLIVAASLEALALQGNEKVLEIGAGSGYVTALLAELAGSVRAIERIGELADAARARLEEMGYRNFQLRGADGTYGWADEAPFDRIIAAASAPEVPEPWRQQLAPGGRLVMPLGGGEGQELVIIARDAAGNFSAPKALANCVFVKLVGKYGWRENGK
ncbi:MAG: protein-L-isoaspartate(D-aspartate) O-methyltransferase [bacterium]|nr:protein-L-isoaspartate(D-aspartate) O-methyltransferase [bacterium]